MTATLSFDKFISHTPHITDMDHVFEFSHYLVYDLELNFHPDTPFEDYICLSTHEPSFSPSEAQTGNRLMEECFDVCEKNHKDVYEETGRVWDEEMKE